LWSGGTGDFCGTVSNQRCLSWINVRRRSYCGANLAKSGYVYRLRQLQPVPQTLLTRWWRHSNFLTRSWALGGADFRLCSKNAAMVSLIRFMRGARSGSTPVTDRCGCGAFIVLKLVGLSPDLQGKTKTHRHGTFGVFLSRLICIPYCQWIPHHGTGQICCYHPDDGIFLLLLLCL